MQQLIILGNGFDLNCGLNSSYNDFFLSRFSQLFRKTKAIPDSFHAIKDELREKIEEIFGDIQNDQIKDCSFEEAKATNNNKYLNFSEWIEQWTNEGSNVNIRQLLVCNIPNFARLFVMTSASICACNPTKLRA